MEKIKPMGHIKTTKSGKSHIPKLIIGETETKRGEEIPYIITAHAVVLYNPRLSAEELSASLEVMKKDVLLREKREKKEKVR